MTSQELVKAAIRGGRVPRLPCGPAATFFCAADVGVSLQRYTLDPDAQVDCILRYHEKYRPDAVWISVDTWVTAEAMGAPVSAPSENTPLTGSPDGFISTSADLERIPEPDPHSRGRQPIMLWVLSKVVEALGQDTFVVGCFDQSPFSLACQAVGMPTLMIRMLEDRPFVTALLEKCLEHSLAYAKAMADCGADMLSTGDSPATLLGPDLYSSMALPWEKKLFSCLAERTDKELSLHICGNTTAILPLMVGSGAHVLEIDHPVDIGDAIAVAGERTALWGNIDPVGVLLEGGPAEVEAAVRCVTETIAADDGSRFVLGSGCVLAPGTPSENVRAFFKAGRG